MGSVKQNAVLPCQTEALSSDGLMLIQRVAAGTRKTFETIVERPIGGDDACDNIVLPNVGRIADSDKPTQLHIFATFGRDDILAKWLPSLQKQIDQKDSEGRTALHLACRYGHTQCFNLLIQAGAKVDVADLSGCTPLHLAIKYRKLVIAQALITKCQETLLMSDNKKRTPLHEAVVTGSTELCRLIMTQCKVSLNAVDTFGRTPLMLACSAGLTNVVTCLLEEYTANRFAAYAVPHPASIADREGAAAIHYAVLQNDLPMLKEVVKHSVLWLNAAKKCGSTALHIAASKGYVEALEILANAGAEVDPIDAEGATPLHRAIQLNQFDCVYMLLLKGANAEIRDYSGKATWHCAAAAGNHEVLTALLTNADQSNMKKLMNDGSSHTPLHYACINGQLKCTEVILDWAKAIDQVTLASLLRAEVSKGSMAIHFAVSRPEYSAVLACLLHYAEDAVSWIDGEMKTPLHLAAEHDCSESVGLLLKHKADMSAADNEGRTALHLACVRGSIKAVRLLLSSGSRIDQRDWKGRQPMMLAAEGSHGAVVKLLLEAGCNVNAVDDQGCTALHIACAANSTEVVQLLLDSECDLTLRSDAGVTALQTSIISRCKEAAIAIVQHEKWQIALSYPDDKGVTAMSQLIKMLPSVAKIVLDRCYTTQPMSDKSDLNPQRRYNFKYIDDDVGGNDSGKANPWPVQEMANGNVDSVELVTHPVVQSMVDHRWQAHARIYMVFQMSVLALHGFLLGMHSSNMTDINASGGVNNCSFSNTTNITMEEQCQKTNDRNIKGLVSTNNDLWTTNQVLLLLTSIYFFLQEVLYWRRGFPGFSLDFPLDICTIITVVTTLICVLPPGYYPAHEVQWHCGWIAMLTTVFSFLLLTRWMDTIGVFTIFISSAILILIPFFLIVFVFLLVYSAVFALLLHRKDEFADFETALVTSMNMVIGEINFSSIFLDNDNPYKWGAIVVELLFLFTFNIALTSFATALVLHDVESMVNEARCITMHHKISWIQKSKVIFRIKNRDEYYIKEKVAQDLKNARWKILAARYLKRKRGEDTDEFAVSRS